MRKQTIEKLVKLADHLDQKGLKTEADYLDVVLKKIAEDDDDDDKCAECEKNDCECKCAECDKDMKDCECKCD